LNAEFSRADPETNSTALRPVIIAGGKKTNASSQGLVSASNPGFASIPRIPYPGPITNQRIILAVLIRAFSVSMIL